MDKNNDIKTNSMINLDTVPDSIKGLRYAISGLFDRLSLIMGLEEVDNDNNALNELLAKVLDDYNELEAKYKEACGMISQYEEENRILREQRKELVDARSELAEDNDDLRREHYRHIDLLDKLRGALEEKGIYCEWSEPALEWQLYGKNKLFDELREHYEEELRIREKEKDEKDKLIDELNSKIKELKLRISMMCSYYGLNPLGELKRKIKELEKENKELKDTIEKDEGFAKWIGNNIVECIKQGAEHGYYEIHPFNRFDIHIEETSLTPMPDRHAIPKIAVQCNNVQTEMERDTAQHECEELNEKVDRLWSVNEELNRKIKELEKENTDLKTILQMCERDANKVRNLGHTIAFNAERARNNKE